MKGFVKISLMSTVLCFGSLIAREQNVEVKKDASIVHNGKEYVISSSNESTVQHSNREEIILFVEDFESGAEGWTTGSGWQLTTDDYNSETHSMNSPNDASTLNGSWNLLSPTWSVPELGEGETMNFGFFLKGDMPDTDGDADDYLDDYYSISIMDIDALAWHASGSDVSMSLDGNSYWCGDEEIGGYLDSWVQFMDTPSFTVPSNGTLTADMMWTIESDAGATVAGSCTDGWDAANVRISSDGGETWSLLNASGLGNDYDFECGYGWIWNDAEYDTGGSLNHLAAGWGNNKDWSNLSFDLGMYAGQEVIVRFAFGSDPAYSTIDDSGITGLRVDNIMVSGSLDCSPENDCDIAVSGAVWVDQFYDYCDADRPGYQEWAEYEPGMAFNGNVFMDISDFAGKEIIMKVQSRYDDNNDGGSGAGLFIDDIKIYKISGGNYPAPIGLTAAPGDGEAMLSWYDMNASGTDNFVYDDDSFSTNDGIIITGGSAWAGERFDVFGASTVNEVHIYNINGDTTITIGAFGQLGTLFNSEPMYTTTIPVTAGWNYATGLGWEMNNSFIIAHEFNGTFSAANDASGSSDNSMVMLNAGWDDWADIATANTLSQGEWGVRANITYSGAGVTYNLYRDGDLAASGISSNMYTDTGLMNNTTYEYTLSATYADGEESGETDPVEVTPFANTVHEEGYDDGSFEAEFNAGSGNFSAVRFTAASSGEDIVRFKWFQNGSGGAFYIKMFEDDGGMPGAEVFSAVQASGNSDGWNEKDLSTQGLMASGDFWIGTKEFSSSKPFGLDTDSNSGNSYQRAGSSGDWVAVDGNLAYHVYLDCGDNCEDEGCSNDSGDVNEDGLVNILDIVQVANYILSTSGLADCGLEAADLNGDGLVNILDIVQIANSILGGRSEDATSALLKLEDGIVSLEADGYIGGVQMTLEHTNDFIISLTDDALLAKSSTTGNHTTLVIVNPANEKLFTHTGDFEISEMIIANSINEVVVTVDQIVDVLPKPFALNAAYPNPFNPTTSMSLDVPVAGHVSVQVFNVMGEVVATLTDGYMEATSSGNPYTMKWNASNVSSGMYLVRAESVGQVSMQKVLLLK